MLEYLITTILSLSAIYPSPLQQQRRIIHLGLIIYAINTSDPSQLDMVYVARTFPQEDLNQSIYKDPLI